MREVSSQDRHHHRPTPRDGAVNGTACYRMMGQGLRCGWGLQPRGADELTSLLVERARLHCKLG